MLKTIRYYAGMGIYYIKLSLLGWMEYPMNLAAWLGTNLLQFNGWTYSQIAFLYGLAMLSHAFSIILFIQTWHIGGIMLAGELDRFLLRPMNVSFQFLFMDFNLIGLTDLLPGVIIFIYGCMQVRFSWTLYSTLAIMAVLFGATLIRGALFMATGSIAFWTKSNSDFSGINLNIMDRTTMYPLTMYPRIIQMIFTFVLPFGFISFFPASAFLGMDNGFSFPSWIIWFTPVVGIAVFTLSCLLFCAGLRKYDSAGS